MPGMGLWDIRPPPGGPTPLSLWLVVGCKGDIPPTLFPPALGVVGFGAWLGIGWGREGGGGWGRVGVLSLMVGLQPPSL